MQELLDNLCAQLDTKLTGPGPYRFDLELVNSGGENPAELRKELVKYLTRRGCTGSVTFLLRGNKPGYIIQVFAQQKYQPTDEVVGND